MTFKSIIVGFLTTAKTELMTFLIISRTATYIQTYITGYNMAVIVRNKYKMLALETFLEKDFQK